MEKDWRRKAQKIRIISDYIKAKQRLIETFGTTNLEEIQDDRGIYSN